jgi:hypothetical protein
MSMVFGLPARESIPSRAEREKVPLVVTVKEAV